jgi:hypothetical protein
MTMNNDNDNTDEIKCTIGKMMQYLGMESFLHREDNYEDNVRIVLETNPFVGILPPMVKIQDGKDSLWLWSSVLQTLKKEVCKEALIRSMMTHIPKGLGVSEYDCINFIDEFICEKDLPSLIKKMIR